MQRDVVVVLSVTSRPEGRASAVTKEAALFRRRILALAMAVFGLVFVAAPAQAAVGQGSEGASQAAPTGCTSWIEWVHEGNSHYYGRAKVQCDTGSYRVKAQCRNLQTGVGYVVTGTQVVSAPNVATVTCYSGNVAESVHAVAEPPAAGVTGCTSWIEWVHQGNNHYYGRAKVQCDTGSYRVKAQCRNLQTGVGYVVYGTQVVSAPNVATVLCYSGNVAESVQAVPQ
ncbi:hypothetical protein N566_12435 [Streptomycetaceae bacterium MP113-05]|nr:hypothetical protein N566_12435 [Streptomycetaceae bacterium MP113-05]